MHIHCNASLKLSTEKVGIPHVHHVNVNGFRYIFSGNNDWKFVDGMGNQSILPCGHCMVLLSVCHDMEQSCRIDIL